MTKNSKSSKSINPQIRGGISRKKVLSPSYYTKGIADGNRVILSQAITLVESELPAHQSLAHQIVENCLAITSSKSTLRIGITGTPGVGKSTFIESLGKLLVNQGHKIAVLAIDPTSQNTRGSILGDKTRMGDIAGSSSVFIRPSPAGSSLGGVARKTRETIILCEAAGFDKIIIETVGVGQSEIAVHSMVDVFLLLLLPGAGDELQGIKRGIVEMADILSINKSDGDRVKMAKQAKKEYENALHLLPPQANGWLPKVLVSSGLNAEGVENVWEVIGNFESHVKSRGAFTARRQEQAIYWMRETVSRAIEYAFYEHKEIKALYARLEKAVKSGEQSPFSAAEQLLQLFNERKL